MMVRMPEIRDNAPASQYEIFVDGQRVVMRTYQGAEVWTDAVSCFEPGRLRRH